MTTITNPFMHFEVIKDYRQAAVTIHPRAIDDALR